MSHKWPPGSMHYLWDIAAVTMGLRFLSSKGKVCWYTLLSNWRNFKCILPLRSWSIFWLSVGLLGFVLLARREESVGRNPLLVINNALCFFKFLIYVGHHGLFMYMYMKISMVVNFCFISITGINPWRRQVISLWWKHWIVLSKPLSVATNLQTRFLS